MKQEAKVGNVAPTAILFVKKIAAIASIVFCRFPTRLISSKSQNAA